MAKIKKEQIQRHIKTHTPRSDDDRNAVTMLSAFLRSDGKIAHNGFACNDTYPNIDDNKEYLCNSGRVPKRHKIICNTPVVNEGYLLKNSSNKTRGCKELGHVKK